MPGDSSNSRERLFIAMRWRKEWALGNTALALRVNAFVVIHFAVNVHN